MDKYFITYREMISLRGLTDHTVCAYSTYIRAYLDCLSTILFKQPEDVSWQELRDFIKWLQKSRALSDRTMNAVISQLRFFTIYVLHLPWDDYQLPKRRFDKYLPFVPSGQETWSFISSISDIRAKSKIQQIFEFGWEDYCDSYQPSMVQSKAAHSIMKCKTGQLGCNVSTCDDCGYSDFHNNSCRNRNCPNCQAVLKEIWIDQRKAEHIGNAHLLVEI